MARRHDQSGAVTAETAAVIPVLVLLTAVLAWMVAFGVTQVRAVDAARETARALARGDDATASTELGMRIAPRGSKISVDQDDREVLVTVRAEVRGPFGMLMGRSVHAEAVAVRETVP